MAERVAIVTGASSGIGRAIALAFGGLGWRVALGARGRDRREQAAREVEAAGGVSFPHVLDVSDPDSVDTFVDAAELALGPIDVLVNNAGMAAPGRLEQARVEDVGQEVTTNLLGPIYVSRRVIASLRARHAAGDLVFISSDAARTARPRLATYSATKAGLEVLARSLAMELEGSRIRATTIRVGPTLTEFGAAWNPDEIRELMEYWPRFGLQRHAGVLEADDVARAVVFALSAPEGVHLDTIEVQPAAPSTGPGDP
jgi:NADP-dependent 3-hydroxy acid dehydrogenase YdfG